MSTADRKVHSKKLGCAMLQVPKLKTKGDKGKQAPEEARAAADLAPEGSDGDSAVDGEPEDGAVSLPRPVSIAMCA